MNKTNRHYIVGRSNEVKGLQNAEADTCPFESMRRWRIRLPRKNCYSLEVDVISHIVMGYDDEDLSTSYVRIIPVKIHKGINEEIVNR